MQVTDLGALADGGAIAVHAGIAAADDHHALAPKIDKAVLGTGQFEFAVDVGDQIRQRLVDTGQVLARKLALDVAIGAHAEKHSIELLEQRGERQIAAHLDTEPELDAHALHDLAALLDHLFLELEGRNAEGQQPADARITIVDDGLDAVTHQDVGAASPAGPAPTMATRLSVARTPDMSGFQPCASASSVMYFSIEPIVTAPSPSLSVQAPSQSRSCGQMRPQTSGSELVRWDSSAASNSLPSAMRLSQLGM